MLFIIKRVFFPFFQQGDDLCKIGDGIGGSEEKLPGSYTIQKCIDAVRLQYPNANGATSTEPCPNECECYAEFGMSEWNSDQSWQSCMFSNRGK